LLCCYSGLNGDSLSGRSNRLDELTCYLLKTMLSSFGDEIATHMLRQLSPAAFDYIFHQLLLIISAAIRSFCCCINLLDLDESIPSVADDEPFCCRNCRLNDSAQCKQVRQDFRCNPCTTLPFTSI